ncbi:MAG: helix-turn-helix domain-containing protein [Lentisphaeria bacterium]|nr:helix-turn-helix domain-containing protein [Lentisphaeria bacterium]
MAHSLELLQERLAQFSVLIGTQCIWKVTDALLPEEELPRICCYHDNAFCSNVKFTSDAEQRCILNDGHDIPHRMSHDPQIFVKVCHANAAEVLIPFCFPPKGCIGVIMAGPFRLEERECRYPKSREHYRKLPLLTPGLKESVIHLVPVIFGDLLKEIYVNFTDKLPRVPTDERILKALDEINRKFRTALTVGEVAEAVYLSESRFIHLFRTECGVNFSDYLLDLRLNEARRFLLSPAWDIRQVANHCGFAGQSYFTARFKRKFGVSPSQFRRDAIQVSRASGIATT